MIIIHGVDSEAPFRPPVRELATSRDSLLSAHGAQRRGPTTEALCATMTSEARNGGAEGIRTLDPHVANVVLSQLSYCPRFPDLPGPSREAVL